MNHLKSVLMLLLFPLTFSQVMGQAEISSATQLKIEKEVEQLMDEGDIPGLSLIIVNEGKTIVKSFGYADLEDTVKVNSETNFEIGSCTKAFTAMALMLLEKEGKVNLDNPVSAYLPWFSTTFKDSAVQITVKQLLFHASGIPWETISLIPQGDQASALEETVRKLEGIHLRQLPGTAFEYATINYDVIGRIIEKQSGMSFERFVKDRILLPLQMNGTSVGYAESNPTVATGYKIGFFQPIEYEAPTFRGNNPAGYVISNAGDMTKWIQFQLGITPSGTILDTLAQQSHLTDPLMPANGGALAAYSSGWNISLSGDGKISHEGLNPNFSAHVSLLPQKKQGVVVMANSNSPTTSLIANRVERILEGEQPLQVAIDGGMDKTFSIITIGMGIYILCVFAFILLKIYTLIKKKAEFRFNPGSLLIKAFWAMVMFIPFLLGVYLLPEAMVGFDWKSAIVWAPVSFVTMTISILAALGISLIAFITNNLIFDNQKYLHAIPVLIVLGFLSGLANTALILIILYTLTGGAEKVPYYLFYFLLTFCLYIMGRKYVQVRLTKLTLELTYEIRTKMIQKIFSTSYQKFESLERGQVYATLNDDTGALAGIPGFAIGFITNLITVLGVFTYMMFISFYTSLLTIATIIVIVLVYHKVGQRSQPLFDDVRDTANSYNQLINGMIDGFKEISLHLVKRLRYKEDMERVVETFRDKSLRAQINFIDAGLIGETLLIGILAVVGFAFPWLFPNISPGTFLVFIAVMLYLIGPINSVMGGVPAIMQMRIAWDRIQDFLKKIPANMNLDEMEVLDLNQPKKLSVNNISYQYPIREGESKFKLGPVSFELNQGEVLFVVGGNGSGKTTLCKVLTGLYETEGGGVEIDGKPVDFERFGEYFSAVFNPIHLFEKIYEINAELSEEEIDQYLQVLGLSGKTSIQDDHYSTINLSQGQRKRLGLLQCYLEDKPIFLFDEWAANQDPDYRRYFYKNLIPEMKKKGKMIIAITHDDLYFDDADKILKLDLGQQESLVEKELEKQ